MSTEYSEGCSLNDILHFALNGWLKNESIAKSIWSFFIVHLVFKWPCKTNCFWEKSVFLSLKMYIIFYCYFIFLKTSSKEIKSILHIFFTLVFCRGYFKAEVLQVVFKILSLQKYREIETALFQSSNILQQIISF